MGGMLREVYSKIIPWWVQELHYYSFTEIYIDKYQYMILSLLHILLLVIIIAII